MRDIRFGRSYPNVPAELPAGDLSLQNSDLGFIVKEGEE
jgi:hypothetical protein